VSHTSRPDPLVIDTLFLDAGGVLCCPAWSRVSEALKTEGVAVSASALAEADPLAKKDIDSPVVSKADDATRGWLYFNKVLEHAGVPLSQATDAALAVLREYHNAENLWEYVPDDVKPALARLRTLGLTLVVVSNANGRLRYLFDRLGLTPFFDVILDSHEWAVEKPDPRLFHIALERAAATPDSTAHVGDLYHIDVLGARKAGLREGILLDVANLYPHVDCRRVRGLDELAASIQLRRGTRLD
jgi:HAD superfamily hydrolase (TIGR01549 family)